MLFRSLAIVAVLVAMLVIRPLVNRAIEATREGPGTPHGGGGHGALPPPGAMGALTGPAGSAMMAVDQGADEDSMIDIGMVDGRVKASSMKKIGEIVDKHPDEAVAIIRSWMYQGS